MTGCSLSRLDALTRPFAQGPFYRLRPPFSYEAAAMSLELAEMTYSLDMEPWTQAGWGDASILIDDSLHSGVAHPENGERLKSFVNNFRLLRAKADLKELSVYLVEAYVGIPSKACRGVDPNHLNLGMRWAVANSPEQVAGWQNFDVFSLNNYSFDPTPLMNFAVGCGVDLPLMIGEFHFGALDRGLPATGLKGTASQTDRAKALRGYIEKAAAHPNAVGVHWFQFCDQNIAGRFDGENYQIGLVDVALRPYPEMMVASRESAMALPGVKNGELPAFDEPFEEIPMIGY